ncbi:MAG TPA: hypothetical protein VF477_19295 [Mycobacterium sp.]
MADTMSTAAAETPVTQAQVPGTFWEVMNEAEPHFRAAWITGSAAILSEADKLRTRRLLRLSILQMERALNLMS